MLTIHRFTLKACLVLALFSLFVFNVPLASAHQGAARSEERQAGVYHLLIEFNANPAHTSQDLQVMVHLLPVGAVPVGTTVTIQGRPGLGTDGSNTRQIRLTPVPGDSSAYEGGLNFTVQGAWNIFVTVQGPQGVGHTTIAQTVSAPGAIPVWLGWLIGLSPLFGVVWFVWWNYRYLGKLRVETPDLALT